MNARCRTIRLTLELFEFAKGPADERGICEVNKGEPGGAPTPGEVTRGKSSAVQSRSQIRETPCLTPQKNVSWVRLESN